MRGGRRAREGRTEGGEVLHVHATRGKDTRRGEREKLSGGWKEEGRRTTEQLKDGVARLGAGIYVMARSYVIWALPRRARESPSLLQRPAPDLRPLQTPAPRLTLSSHVAHSSSRHLCAVLVLPGDLLALLPSTVVPHLVSIMSPSSSQQNQGLKRKKPPTFQHLPAQRGTYGS